MRSLNFALLLALSVPLAARAQATRQTGQSASEPRTWRTPWDKTRPRDPYADQQGRVWFVGQVGKLSPIAYEIQGYKYNRAIFNPTAARMGQAIAGELSLDDAMKRISADIDEQVKAASK